MYQVHVRADFATEGTDGAGNPVEALRPLESVGYDLDLRVAVTPSREFRDGSAGSLVRFERAWALLRRGGGEARVDPAGIEGRSVEVRTFADGEILAIDFSDHLAGFPRYGEVFDLLFYLLIPSPPALDTGVSAAASSSWPFRLWGLAGWSNTLRATWTHEGMVGERGAEAWRLAYTGAWTSRGRLSETASPGSVSAAGTAEGEVQISRADHSLLAHSFSWQRTVRLVYAEAPGGPAEVRQRQAFVGALERVAP
jgi:hypothetical protein